MAVGEKDRDREKRRLCRGASTLNSFFLPCANQWLVSSGWWLGGQPLRGQCTPSQDIYLRQSRWTSTLKSQIYFFAAKLLSLCYNTHMETGQEGDSMISYIQKWWKRGLILLSLFVMALGLSACGSEKKTIAITPDTGEKIDVTLDGGDDFNMDYVNGVLMVYQKKKVMMRFAFITKDMAIAQKKSASKVPSEIHRDEDSYIFFSAAGPEGMVDYYLFPVGDKTWAYGATHLPPEAAEKVMGRLHFNKKS
jgi:hypothetical protein